MGGQLRRVLIYALGGGAGHAVRGLGLQRALHARGVEATLLIRKGAAPTAERARDVFALERPDAPDDLARTVAAHLAARPFELMVVDAFPSGILGELGAIAARPPCALLLRLHTGAGQPDFARAAAGYDRVIDIEPHLEWCPPSLDAQRLAPPVGGWDGGAGGDVTLVGGTPALDAFLDRLGRRLEHAGLTVRRADASGDVPRSKILVGPAGYNLTYEAVAAGVWHLALPRLRRFDDQQTRAERVAEVTSSPEALEARVIALVRSGGRRPPGPPTGSYADLASALLAPRARSRARFSARNMSQA